MSLGYQRQQQRAVTLTDSAVDALKAMQDSLAMPQKHIISRIVEWFAGLSDEGKSLVLGVLPVSLAEHAAISLLDDIMPADADIEMIAQQVIMSRQSRSSVN